MDQGGRMREKRGLHPKPSRAIGNKQCGVSYASKKVPLPGVSAKVSEKAMTFWASLCEDSLCPHIRVLQTSIPDITKIIFCNSTAASFLAAPRGMQTLITTHEPAVGRGIVYSLCQKILEHKKDAGAR